MEDGHEPGAQLSAKGATPAERQPSAEVSDLPTKILEITLAVLLHKDEERILELIGQAMVDLFPIKKLAIYRTDPATSAWNVCALVGFPEAQAREARKVVYDKDSWKETLRISEKIGFLSYFVPGEYVVIDDYDTAFYEGFPKKIPPRESPDHWHPMDFIDTLLFDKDGKELGCIEILETSDHRKPTSETISKIEIVASIASIAIELSNVWRSQEKLISANSSRAKVFARMLDLATNLVSLREDGLILSGSAEFLAEELGFRNCAAALWDPLENAYRVILSTRDRAPTGTIPKRVVSNDCDPLFRFTDNLFWMPSEQLTDARLGHAPFTDEDRTVMSEMTSAEVPPDEATRRRHDMFAVPLKDRRNGLVAVIYATDRESDVFFEKDLLELMSVFGSIVSLAFRNSGAIGEVVQTNENLEMLNRLLFHDISNHNTAIDFFVTMARRPEATPEQRTVALEKGRKQIELSNELIARVKKLVYIREKGSERLLTVDLVPTLNGLTDEMRESRPDKRLRVTMASDEPTCMVRANELMHDLFQNLLNNAIKYTSGETVDVEIRIARVTEGNREYWDTRISDRGTGIPDDKKEQIFARFAPRVSGGTGIGLGLSIVRSIVDQYGGRVWVEDRVRGDHSAGATFHVLLPTA